MEQRLLKSIFRMRSDAHSGNLSGMEERTCHYATAAFLSKSVTSLLMEMPVMRDISPSRRIRGLAVPFTQAQIVG